MLTAGRGTGCCGTRVQVLTSFLTTAQKVLRDLKAKISSQSKKNFVLEKDVRYLDSRIALLIQNRMALEEVCKSAAPVHCDPS